MPMNLTATINGGAIVRLTEASRLIGSAIEGLCREPADRAMAVDPADLIREAMRKLGMAQKEIDLAVPPDDLEPADVIDVSQFIRHAVPEGYDTVLGLIAKEDPGLIHAMPELLVEVESDHVVLEALTAQSGLPFITLDPMTPEDCSLTATRAYPVGVIRQTYL